ncbi:MAG: hypothetical protein WCF23_21340 [Candidatus Nitrosopolaris sp.]
MNNGVTLKISGVTMTSLLFLLISVPNASISASFAPLRSQNLEVDTDKNSYNTATAGSVNSAISHLIGAKRLGEQQQQLPVPMSITWLRGWFFPSMLLH